MRKEDLCDKTVQCHTPHTDQQEVVAAARERHLEISKITEFQSHTGGGVRAIVGITEVLIGSYEFLAAQGININTILIEQASQLQSKGATVVFVGTGIEVAATLEITDPIKANARDSLQQLRKLGINILMITGDSERTARTVAEQVGIRDFEAGVKPERKHDRIVELRRRGHVVAMAGDGINDAPALAASNVGIAMGAGTDIAIESADVILVKGDLRGIVRALYLSRATMRNIRQNLFFAFVYNLLGVPIAAGVLVPLLGISALLNPMLAAAAMSISSVSVIANALRLRATKLA